QVNGIDIAGSTGYRVEGNFIGTNKDGTGPVANGNDGVLLSAGATNNVIGGTPPGAGNGISGNGVFGGYITRPGPRGNAVAGNSIGTNKDGNASLPNDSTGTVGGGGVGIDHGASSNTIGGTTAAARNLISGNRGYGGVVIYGGASNNTVAGNSIGTNK